MIIISSSVKRPKAMIMFSMVILLTGSISITHLPLELTPNIDFPELLIRTSWANTSPEIVEAHVTSQIEAAVNKVPNVHEIYSVSKEGESEIVVKFNRGTNMDLASMELNEKLSVLYDELPNGVSFPRIIKTVPREFQTGRFFSLHVTGPYSPQELRSIAKDKILIRLLTIEGIAHVEVTGGQEREVQILINEELLNFYGISLNQIQKTLHDLGYRQTLGMVKQNGQQITLILNSPIRRSMEIENAIVKQQKNSTIRIKHIARIIDTYRAPTHLSRIDGYDAVTITIEREKGSNTVHVGKRIAEKLNEICSKLPPGLRLVVIQDQSRQIRKKLSDLRVKALFSILIVFLVLMVFLHNYRAPLLILLTVFLSILCTINLFALFRITLNLLTLAGLTMGFGMLVDNAIVVVENITSHYDTHKSRMQSAITGTSEIVFPVVASTLTTLAAFLPFLHLTGDLRIYYLPFAMTLGFSLLSSLVVAFTLTPSLTVKLFPEHLCHGKDLFLKTKRSYKNSLIWIIGHRRSVCLLAVFILCGSFYLFQKFVTRDRIFPMWKVGPYIMVTIHMPRGAGLQRTDEITRRFEALAIDKSPVCRTSTNVWPDHGTIMITFPGDEKSQAFALLLMEKIIHTASQIAGPSIGVSGFGEYFNTGGGANLSLYTIRILGYNYKKVSQISSNLGERLEQYSRVKNIRLDGTGWSRDDSHEIVLTINRELLKPFGITPRSLLLTIQEHLQETAGWNRLKIDGAEVSASIKFQGHQTFSMEDLKNLLIQTPSGEPLRLKNVSYIEKQKTITRIHRKDQHYQRLVNFEYRGPYKLGNLLVDNILKTTHLPPGYRLKLAFDDFFSKEQKKEIYFILTISIALVFLVTAALFESLLHPILILLTIPLSLSGVFLIFFFTGIPFDRSAYIGVVLLEGIVVNDSILLVYHINLIRRRGEPVVRAVVTGAMQRLRPILMTTLTTIGGLLPLILLNPDVKEIWYTLALTATGGLLYSTLMVLTIVPVMYVGMERMQIGVKRHIKFYGK